MKTSIYIRVIAGLPSLDKIFYPTIVTHTGGVELFDKEPAMIAIETAHYIKGMHNLLSAHFDLLNYPKFLETLNVFENFFHSEAVQGNDNNRIQTFVYLHIAKINQHFIDGTFTEGLSLVPFIEEKLKEYEIYLDRHRILIFYYKFASLYFGSSDYELTIKYLNKIINWKMDLRTDLQCYSRLLHLIAHYELGNDDLLEYLIKSVYRFMAKNGKPEQSGRRNIPVSQEII